jgi:MFS family permease
VLHEQLLEMQERQNLSRMDTAVFLLIPITTLCVGLSTNWVLDPRYFHLGFAVGYVLWIVIALTVGVFVPTVLAYLFAYLKDSIALRIGALKIFLAACSLWTFGISFLVMAYVPDFVKQYDSGVAYSLAGIGGILVVISLASLPYFWLSVRCLLWFQENVPHRFRRETMTPWWGDKTDATKITILLTKAMTLNGLIAMAAASYFALLIRFTCGGAVTSVAWVMLVSCALSNAYSITKDVSFLRRKLKVR